MSGDCYKYRDAYKKYCTVTSLTSVAVIDSEKCREINDMRIFSCTDGGQ